MGKKSSLLLGVILTATTCGLVYVLNRPTGALPALGRLLDPVNGCWANAEPVNEDFSGVRDIPGVLQEVKVWFDDRLTPHIHAQNDRDAYFVQGYIHASFRLWQMDMQTRAAAGRVSEVVGEKALPFDRKQRRKGMVYAAENSLKTGLANPASKLMLEAYTDGINAYMATLTERAMPLEYKLMGFKPEPWTPLKSALLLKYMADDLTGNVDDIALTYLRDALPADQFALLFPERDTTSSPVIPKGTVFEKPSLAAPLAPADSAAFPHFTPADFGERREDGKGSNNWVVSGNRTASGAPILCNDPHLALNLPSLWYEIQLQSPGMNVYGASLPGAPGVIIGFNDSVSWGVTNNYRDVKDYYLIKQVAGNAGKYWFAGKEADFTNRVERIAVKGKPDVVDTVKYTIHGPVMYDDKYKDKTGLQRMLAVCWMGHRGTNEMLAIYNMNRATGYNSFVSAIMNFECPAQNMAYADRQGNIAIWGQGQFVNKWKNQGRYVMDGSDSATLWKELIPMRENPHVLNPERGFVSSANQTVTDASYPYWYNGSFIETRSWRINHILGGMQKATMQDMFALQQDTYSILAEKMLPKMLSKLNDKASSSEHTIVAALKKWDYKLAADSKEATVFQIWWTNLYWDWWRNRFDKVPDQLWPSVERTMQLLQSDDIEQIGLFSERVNASFVKAMDSVHALEKVNSTKKTDEGGKWYMAKNTSATHLTKLPAFSYDHLKIGGWGNTVNAAKGGHGPSWRMVVQMGKEIEAYAVYPGGQSGNPGSKYYASFLQTWAAGGYNKLHFLPNAPSQPNPAIKYTLTLKPKA